MRYDITLRMSYDYGGLADHARNLLRLVPLDLPGRQILSSHILTIDPLPYERRDGQDFFGNATTHIAFHAPVQRLAITMRARAEILAADPALDLSPPLRALPADLRAARSLGSFAPHHFLGASPRVHPRDEMTAWARGHLREGGTVREAVLRIGAALHQEMRFDAGVTDVDTDPLTAFRNRHGVCQDFSHVMIACLRGLGIPAGYVSGFLRTEPPEGQPRLEGADAMHAWVRAWCGGEGGWIEFDPTNDVIAGSDHLVVGYGRDYSDVAPVRGAVRASGRQMSGHTVDVVPLDTLEDAGRA